MESEPSLDIRVWSSPLRARSRTKTGGVHTVSPTEGPGGGNGDKMLTEAPFVLKRPVQTHDARVSGPEADQRVLLGERGLLLLVALQMGFVYPLDGVLLARREQGAQPHLYARVRGRYAPAGEGRGAGGRELTVEYEPWPSSSRKSKSSTVMRPLTELLRDLDWAREAGGRSGDGSSSGMPSSFVR